MLRMILALVLAWPLLAAPTRIAFASAEGASPKTTGAITTTGASLLVVIVSDNGYGTPGNIVSDSNGNTWYALATTIRGGDCITIFYAYDHGGSALSVGSGHTATVTYAGKQVAFTWAAYSGTLSTGDPYDGQLSGSSPSGDPCQPGSITPTVNGTLLVLGVSYPYSWQATTTVSVTNSLVAVDWILESGASFSQSYIDGVQTTAAAINPTVTNSANVPTTLTFAAFKPATVAPSRRNALVF